MSSESKNGFSYGKMGIFIGIFFVFLSIIWITLSVISDDDTSGEDITWVG
ncbi:MAG: hypothetical protein JXB48_09685 [Candidatus Latescibacteria bacterium]|nr:hypothetical protein [Candidatus Latescibacterota bacterium]